MNLYLISQKDVFGYETYDSAVVAAESLEEAATIHPDGGPRIPETENEYYLAWTNDPEKVSVTLLALNSLQSEAGVVLASFNAG